VIGFVGSSGAGKTTLLERVIAALEARRLAVGAVKHASHGFAVDRPGKDSFRLQSAGARAVALASRGALALFRRMPEAADADPPLAHALAVLPAGLDVVLVEGFSWEPIPRFVVVAAGEAPRPEHLRAGEVIRIVRAGSPDPSGCALAAASVESVVRDVLARIRSQPLAERPHAPGGPGANGAVPLGPRHLTCVISRPAAAAEHPLRGR
jgi:molybdopterin-guanine dinucleotide biosynthesis protein B